MPEGAWLPWSPLLSLSPISAVRTGLGCEAVTADNEAKHELGDKQKAPKSSPQQGAE